MRILRLPGPTAAAGNKNVNPVWKVFQRSLRVFIVVAGVSLIINILGLVSPVYMMQVYDRILTSRSEMTLVFMTVAAIGLVLVLGVLDDLRNRFLVRIGVRLDADLHETAFQAVFRRSLIAPEGARSQALQDIAILRNFAFRTGTCLDVRFAVDTAFRGGVLAGASISGGCRGRGSRPSDDRDDTGGSTDKRRFDGSKFRLDKGDVVCGNKPAERRSYSGHGDATQLCAALGWAISTEHRPAGKSKRSSCNSQRGFQDYSIQHANYHAWDRCLSGHSAGPDSGPDDHHHDGGGARSFAH